MSWEFRGRAITVTDHTMRLDPFEPLTIAALRAFVKSTEKLEPSTEVRILGDGQDHAHEIVAEVRESVQVDIAGPQKCPDCEYGVRFPIEDGEIVAEVCETCGGRGHRIGGDQ